MLGLVELMASSIELNAQEILEKEEKSFGHTAIPINRLIKKLILASDKPEGVLLEELLESTIISSRKNDQSSVICSTLKASTLERQIAEQFSRLIKTFSSTKASKKLTKADTRLEMRNTAAHAKVLNDQKEINEENISEMIDHLKIYNI